MNHSKIPVTILSGFLGSGKTTLLNRLIKDHPEKKFAIIENEFGEIGIDNELVIGAEEGIFEMSNGCICCSMNEELEVVLQKLLSTEKKIDHLIVETTGIADPGPVAMTFLSQNVKHAFHLNAVITLVDAQFIEQQLEDQEEVCKQIAMADVVLVNKIDKVDSYQSDTVKNIVRRMNAQAEVIECRHGKVNNFDLLSQNSFSKEKLSKDFEMKLSEKVEFLKLKSVDASEKPSFLFSPQHTKSLQHSDITSFSFVFSDTLDIMKFDIWLRMMLNHKTFRLYRVKGILSFNGVPDKIILQAVNNQYVTEGGGEWKGERENKIVFIGKKLQKEILIKGLKFCTYTDKPFDPAEFYEQMKEFELV